LQARKPTSSA